MNEFALVSIITPTYNHERYIGECIQSVQAQTYANWEMLIVDDGSSDRTWEIIQTYAASDKRIRAFRQANKGILRLGEIYNFALSQAQAGGEFVAILEGDDYWPINKLQQQVNWHVAHPDIVLSYGQYVNIHPDKTLAGEVPARFGRLTGLEWFELQATRQSGIIAAAVVMSRSSLTKLGGFVSWDGFPAVDSPTYFSLARLPGAIFYIGRDVTAFWRHHANQITGSKGFVLAEMNTQKVIELYDSLSEDEVRTLTTSRSDILKARYAGLADAYLEAVRGSLVKKNRGEALQLLSPLWRYGGPKRKLQALAAWLAAHIGSDIEILFTGYDYLSNKARIPFSSNQRRR